MFGIADYGAFVVAIIVFLAIPGPGNLALLTATGKGGVRAGMAATFGVISGDQVLLWLAVAGLSAVLINYPGLYSSVQWAGAQSQSHCVLFGFLPLVCRSKNPPRSDHLWLHGTDDCCAHLHLWFGCGFVGPSLGFARARQSIGNGYA